MPERKQSNKQGEGERNGKKKQQPQLETHALPSARGILSSAKALPSAALGKGYTAKISSAKTTLPSDFCRALDKEKLL
jgi:hypothetical protein